MENFNRTDNRINDLLQTPKNSSKFERSLLFSPEEKLQTPCSRNTNINNLNSNGKVENVINLRNLGLGNFSTPRNVNKSHFVGGSNKQFEDGLTLDEFDQKLLLQNQNQTQVNNLSQNYSLLSAKNNTRIGRIMGGQCKNNDLLSEAKKSKIDFNIKDSVFAGYNKTEPRKSVSKSPLSLRKSKPKFGFPLTENNVSYNSQVNNGNSQLNQSFYISSDRLNNSIIKFKDDVIHQPQKFGMTSYLSDIKPINNYNTQLDTSKFSFTTNDNLLKLSNMSNLSNI
jgi:hypothetical protein